VLLNKKWFSGSKNLFTELIPESTKYEDLISVFDVSSRGLKIMSDVVSQKVVCFSGQ
jgi:hypothetical protein